MAARGGGFRHKPAALAAFVLVQSLAAVFFLGDVVADYLAGQLGFHLWFELLVALALALGVMFGAITLRQTLEEMRMQDIALASARGALGDVIAAQFTQWGLTPAERDVGFLALKGLDVAEIAEVRGAASGTVRAQLTRIYAKAGVTGRAQFAAWFVEDLLGEGLEGQG
ncbi:helix-turn-helix transcriptional regulator [Tabrizicola sp.]|jgi:DNA-binding CsgD family transcriptional regulator|uniref:helix-turn-helix transcriptional regulator n=1 Tax=Tabrizicola sp. TaxID=2005166 RepID=UPI003D2BCCC9